MLLHRRLWAATLLLSLLASLLGGCGSSGVGQSGVDGYWKGQVVEEPFTASGMPTKSASSYRPRRILLRLEENSGIVEGRFAQSSDAVTFRLIGEEGSRSLATQPVTGTFDGTRLRILFPAGHGRLYEVDAVVSRRTIEGTYVVRDSAGDPQQTLSGRFEVERF